MKVVVTGGSGQLGTLVLRRLLDDRSIHEVVSLDKRPPLIASGKLRAIEIDVRDPAIGRPMEGAEVVVHLAFMLAQHAERSLLDAVNVGGSQNVFRAAVAAGARTIVYSSSVAAYGVAPCHPQPLVEDSPRVLVPDFAYSATKFQVEEFLDVFEKEHPEVAISRLRPTVLVGRDMDHPLGLALRLRRLPETGAVPLPLVWDEDVADAVVLCLKKRARGAFNVVAEEAIPGAELARRTGLRVLELPDSLLRAFARLTPYLEIVGLARRSDPRWLEPLPPMVASSAKARSELGWSPRCATNVQVVERLKKVVPCVPDPRIPLWLWTSAHAIERGLATVDLGGFDSRVHLRVDGCRGGDWTIRVEERHLRVGWGAPRPPTATVSLDAGFLLDLLAGRADPATAQLTGKLRVQGEGHAALLVGGMISGFRASAKAPGTRGRASRILSWLMERRREVPV